MPCSYADHSASAMLLAALILKHGAPCRKAMRPVLPDRHLAAESEARRETLLDIAMPHGLAETEKPSPPKLRGKATMAPHDKADTFCKPGTPWWWWSFIFFRWEDYSSADTKFRKLEREVGTRLKPYLMGLFIVLSRGLLDICGVSPTDPHTAIKG